MIWLNFWLRTWRCLVINQRPQIKRFELVARLYQKYLKGKELTEAMKHLGRTEGVITDPVYECKSIAALIDLVR